MKKLFDLIRRLKGKPLTQAEVDQVNAMLESARVPDAPSQPELPVTPHRISPKGVALIKQFEGCEKKLPSGMLAAYPDPGTGGAPWTIGWGATGPDIGPKTKWTQKQADEWFDKHIQRYARDVLDALGEALVRTSQDQFDAMVSWHYNCGAIARATLTAKHKAGNYKGAADEFLRWNRAGGRVLAGLTRRRQAERKLYRSGSS